jgi:hypothetical protein
VGFSFVAPNSKSNTAATRSFMAPLNDKRRVNPRAAHRLPINVDMIAIGIALTLAALIRFNVIHQISF